MRAIAQLEIHLVSPDARRKYGEASGDGHIVQARLQPATTVRADRLSSPGVLQPSRKQPVETRSRNGMTDKRRPNIWPSVENRTEGPERVQPRALQGPLHSAFTNQHFHICLGLVQEGCRLESTLTGADHHDSFSAKAGQVTLLRGVRSQVPGDARKLRRSHSKRSDPSTDDNSPPSNKLSLLP